MIVSEDHEKITDLICNMIFSHDYHHTRGIVLTYISRFQIADTRLFMFNYECKYVKGIETKLYC